MERQVKLTSLKRQRMINLKTLEDEIFAIVLRFGRKKDGQFTFPVIFKNTKKLSECHDELQKLIGEPLKKVRLLAIPIYNKYSQFNYKSKKAITTNQIKEEND